MSFVGGKKEAASRRRPSSQAMKEPPATSKPRLEAPKPPAPPPVRSGTRKSVDVVVPMVVDELPNYELLPPTGGDADEMMREDFGPAPSPGTAVSMSYQDPITYSTADPILQPVVAAVPTPARNDDTEQPPQPLPILDDPVSPDAKPSLVHTVPAVPSEFDANMPGLDKSIASNVKYSSESKLLPKYSGKPSAGFSFDIHTPSEIYFNSDPMTIRVVPPILQYIPNRPNNVYYVQKAIDNLKYYLQNIIDFENMNMMTFFISYDENQKHKIYFEEIVLNLMKYNPNRANVESIIDLFENYYTSFTNIFDILLYVIVNINYSKSRPRAITHSLLNFINACAQYIENKMVNRLAFYKISKNTNPALMRDANLVNRVHDIQLQLTAIYNANLLGLTNKLFYKYTSDNADDTFEQPALPENPNEQISEMEFRVEFVNTDLYF